MRRRWRLVARAHERCRPTTRLDACSIARLGVRSWRLTTTVYMEVGKWIRCGDEREKRKNII